ncbi:MAG: diguanylate cyclase [Spirochaeta sp.]|jgi:diguanylate cyclase (GGDEF)-like protein|nr:diguanylate cyclase [Spirochaeta sp.]
MNTEADKQTVLIVDDEPGNVQAVANLLKDECRIQVANNGEKAISIASGTKKPDLILLDVLMPGIDGYEVCKQLKEKSETSTIPIIFVTARDTVSDEEKGFLLGALDYISKPFHPALVRARVRTHLSLKRKTDLLEQISMLDGLTGIPNRRSFDEQIEKESRRTRRGGQSLSVVIMDIDLFKQFNDNYGHGLGDQCLQKVARALENVAERSGDVVARYGGEEFVAVLPATDAEGAAAMAEKFRVSVEALAVPHEYSSVTNVVTLSLGVATVSPGAGNDDDAVTKLLKRADEALYAAKKAGRNRCVVAPAAGGDSNT